jgi:Spy/CpxP family protein refolding chaperone
MKKIILLTLAASFTIASVQAQEIPERKTERPAHHQGKGMKGHHGMDMKELNLTEAQKEQFKQQREENKKKMEALKSNDNITVKEWKSQMETLRKENKAKMDGILTTEQKAKMEKIKVEGEAKRKEMGQKQASMMKERLGLTDDQSAKLSKHRTEMGEKMKAIRENKSLSDEQKKEQLKELHKSQKDAMKSILTEEQMKKMKEGGMHKRRPHGEGKKPEPKMTT